MALPSISDIARLTADPDLRNVNSGKAVCKARLAFNESRFNRDTRSWEDGATFYVDAELWEDQAERFADQLRKGDDVFVTGELKTDTWESNGDRKSKTVLRVRRYKPVPRNTPQQPQEARTAPNGRFGSASTSGGGWGAQRGAWDSTPQGDDGLSPF